MFVAFSCYGDTFYGTSYIQVPYNYLQVNLPPIKCCKNFSFEKYEPSGSINTTKIPKTYKQIYNNQLQIEKKRYDSELKQYDYYWEHDVWNPLYDHLNKMKDVLIDIIMFPKKSLSEVFLDNKYKLSLSPFEELFFSFGDIHVSDNIDVAHLDDVTTNIDSLFPEKNQFDVSTKIESSINNYTKFCKVKREKLEKSIEINARTNAVKKCNKLQKKEEKKKNCCTPKHKKHSKNQNKIIKKNFKINSYRKNYR
jgi:hypothetical protein